MSQQTINRKKYNRAEYDALRNDASKQVVEVAEIGILSLAAEEAGKEISIKVTSEPEVISIDKTFKNQKEGRVLVIAASGRSAKGQKYSFSMTAEQADQLKTGSTVTCLAVLDNNGTKARLTLVNAA